MQVANQQSGKPGKGETLEPDRRSDCHEETKAVVVMFEKGCRDMNWSCKWIVDLCGQKVKTNGVERYAMTAFSSAMGATSLTSLTQQLRVAIHERRERAKGGNQLWNEMGRSGVGIRPTGDRRGGAWIECEKNHGTREMDYTGLQGEV